MIDRIHVVIKGNAVKSQDKEYVCSIVLELCCCCFFFLNHTKYTELVKHALQLNYTTPVSALQKCLQQS